jgi:glucose dehydrogenase
MAQWCRDRLASLRNEGLFTPPSVRGAISFPGNIGGVDWGGAAWDPERRLLIANTNRVAAIMKIIPREDLQAAMARKRLGRGVRAAIARHGETLARAALIH